MGDDYLNMIANHPKMVWRRGDFRRNVLLVASLFIDDVDYVSGTCTPGNWPLQWMSGLGDGTVRRAKQWLKANGFLGMVATGRCGEYTPATSDGFSHFSYDMPTGKVADRAVFVVTVPMTDEELVTHGEELVERMKFKCKYDPLVERWSQLVDVNGHPSRSKANTGPEGIKDRASHGLKAHFLRAAEYVAGLAGARTDLSWPLTATTEAGDEATTRFNELQAARTVILHTPSLRDASAESVRRACARFFRAGWVAKDILVAIDELPDGSRRSHDGFYGARNPVAMLQNRLADWRVGETIMYSVRQRSEIRAARNVARKMEEAKARELAAVQEHGMPSQTAEGFSRGIAQLKALFRK